MSSTYLESINWLFALQKFGIKLGLSSITHLLELLGNPHRGLRCIHIAGTNGKGSTAAYLHSICRQAGYRPGLYTSPHLTDFTERIVISGVPIKKNDVVLLVKRLRLLCSRNNLENITFFEFATALALTYFAEQKADPVILETGMGGRLDATNIVQPLIAIITSISLEHTEHLGPTLLHIAREKAGIIKKGRACISAVTRPGPRDCIRQTCSARQAPLFEYGRDFSIRSLSGGYCFHSKHKTLSGLRPSLAGNHQTRNASLAVAAAELLCSMGYSIPDQAVRNGLHTCFWPGRYEVIQTKPRHIVLDGAHNPAAWQALVRALKTKYSHERIVLIIGIMRDKNMRSLKRLVGHAHTCIFFKPRIERAAPREYLEKYIVFSQKKRVFWCETIAQAIEEAHSKTGPRDIICVTGSLFAVGEAREQLKPNVTKTSGRIGL